MEKIVIDTDPGIDDAVAIACALHCDSLDVQLFTTVAGNISVEKTTSNILKLLHFFKRDIPVAKGIAKPLVRELKDASGIHGPSGMDGYEFEQGNKTPIEKNAVEALRDLLKESNKPITLVTIGPLTNIAVLFTLYPEYKSKVKKIVMMGGSSGLGNETPAAEFNMFADPEAAKIVLSSDIPIVMCGLDITNKATLTSEVSSKLRETNKTGVMLYSLFQHYRGGSLKTGLKMHDLCTIAYLDKPELFKTQKCFVDVETNGEYCSGRTIVDLRDKLKRNANVTFCTDIDVEGFRQWTVDILSKAL